MLTVGMQPSTSSAAYASGEPVPDNTNQIAATEQSIAMPNGPICDHENTSTVMEYIMHEQSAVVANAPGEEKKRTCKRKHVSENSPPEQCELENSAGWYLCTFIYSS
jgi:hypothetical protein